MVLHVLHLIKQTKFNLFNDYFQHRSLAADFTFRILSIITPVGIHLLFAKSIEFRANHTPKLNSDPHLGLKLDMLAFEAATNSVTCWTSEEHYLALLDWDSKFMDQRYRVLYGLQRTRKSNILFFQIILSFFYNHLGIRYLFWWNIRGIKLAC